MLLTSPGLPARAAVCSLQNDAMTRSTLLDIAKAAARQDTPEHKRFRTLLEKIEKARARLAAWQTRLPLFAQAYSAQVAPQQARLQTARREFAFELEVLLARVKSRADRETLSQMICDVAGSLLDAADPGEPPDEPLKALYNRHAPVDFDTEAEEDLASMKAMLESIGGVDLGDEPLESPEDLLRRAQAKMAEQTQARASRPGRKRKAKTASEKRAEEDERRVSQTVREVYRKLASELHPDRSAADTPDAEREARTALMQQANAAYEAGDLLTLLTLQLKTEQIDLAGAAGVAAEQVRHFNRVLGEQLRELEMEIGGREHAFCASYGLMPERRPDPEKLQPLLKQELREIEFALLDLTHTRRLLQGDAAQLKRLLKQWRAEQRDDDFGLPF
jgi:ribosomal protein L12E/L44/L45/RPP1/RPP2